MPTALDRLVASPSALRALRSIVNAHRLPAIWIPALDCCHTPSHKHKWNSTLAEDRKDGNEATGQSSPFLGQSSPMLNIGHDSTPPVLDIEYESAVLHPPGSRQRRVDNPDEPNKFLLWAQLLQYQYRVRDQNGIGYIWRGMMRRNITLPTDTEEASMLWGTLIRNRGIAKLVLTHAVEIYEKTGSIYPGLYEECIGYWLPKRALMAYEFHKYLVDKLQLKGLPLRKLAPVAILNDKGLGIFSDIYKSSNERNLYSSIVPVLFDKGKVEKAREWHKLCIAHNDFPTPGAASHRLVRKFTKRDTVLVTPPVLQYPTDHEGFEFRVIKPEGAELPPLSARYNRELIQRLTDREVQNIRYDDPFCARLFATRAFPISSIIRGLRLIGVSEIGPQALRELALRANPITDMERFYEQFEEVGVSVRSCVFTLAMEKFTKEKNFAMVRSLLESDQHPDVLEDAETQTKLLDYFLVKEDWEQAHRTLVILTFFHRDVKTESWNLVLQARCRQRAPGRITQVLEEMRENQIDVNGVSIKAIIKVLRHRNQGRRPATVRRKTGLDDLRFVAQTLISILESGLGYVHPWLWREIMRRYGMLGRIRELRRLAHWLLHWYAPLDQPEYAHLLRSELLHAATTRLQSIYTQRQWYFNLPRWVPPWNKWHPLRQLFPDSFQQGLVIWGFRAGLIPESPLEQSMFSGAAGSAVYKQRFMRRGILRRLHWSVGLRLLVELRDAGVFVQDWKTRYSCYLMFTTLYGRRVSNKTANRLARMHNCLPYHEYTERINTIWRRELIPQPWRKKSGEEEGTKSEEESGAKAESVQPRPRMENGPLQALKQLERAHLRKASPPPDADWNDVVDQGTPNDDGLQALMNLADLEKTSGGRKRRGKAK